MPRKNAFGPLLLLAACQQSGDQQVADKESPAAAAKTEFVLQPGEWESRSEILSLKILPMETAQGTFVASNVSHSPPSTTKFCLSPEQASRPQTRFVILTGVSSTSCDIDKVVLKEGVVGGTITCALMGESTEYALKGRYTATSYDVTTKMQARVDQTTAPPAMPPELQGLPPTATPMDMETKVTARRLGDC